MAMTTCDFCNDLIDLDAVEGEFDIKDNDGNSYDFVCIDCVCNNEEFDDE